MNERRRFLKVLSATAATVGVGACGDRVPTAPPPSAAGNTTSTGSGNTNTSGNSSVTSGAGGGGGGGGMPGPMIPDTLPMGLEDGGHIDDFTTTVLREIDGYQTAYLGLDDDGCFCMTAICAHESCPITLYGEITATGLKCGCHGSEYDNNGGVAKGPTTMGLQHFYVVVDINGNIGFDPGMDVGDNYRAPVPTLT